MGKPLVLVVDDESAVRALIAALLGENGFEVLQAGDGFEAVLIASRNHIDLLITDNVMPGMCGAELIQRVREAGLARSFLLMSGYSGDSLQGLHGLWERVPFLEKPFTAAQLFSKVRQALTGCRPETPLAQTQATA